MSDSTRADLDVNSGRDAVVVVLVAAFLVVEAVVVAATGGARSAFYPLFLVAPFVLAFGHFSAPAARLLTIGTVVIGFFAAVMEIASGPAPLPREALAATTLVALVAGSAAGMVRRRRFLRAAAAAAQAQAAATRAIAASRSAQVSAAAALAHELKNPLAAMQGLATLVASRSSTATAAAAAAGAGGAAGAAVVPGARREDLDGVVDDIRAMSRLVTELLDFSRPTSAEALRRVSVVELVAAAAEEAGEAVVDVSADATLVIVVEPRKAERVLRALLGLAAARAGSVKVGARADSNGVEITVSADAAIDDAQERLSLARALLEEHGGRLVVVERRPFCARALFPALEGPWATPPTPTPTTR